MSRVEETNDVFDCAGTFVGYYTPRAFKKRVFDFLPPESQARYRKIVAEAKRTGNKEDLEYVQRGLTDELKLRYNTEMFNERAQFVEIDFLMLCMSEARDESDPSVVRDESLMWAHYAEKGKGLRIELELDEPFSQNFFRVNYADEVPTCDLANSPSVNNRAHKKLVCEFLDKRAMTKSRAWSYEHEVRLVRIGKDPRVKHKGKLAYLELDPRIVKRVDFGPHCFKDEHAFLREVDRLKESGYGHVEFRLARMDPKTYGFRYVTEETIRRSAAFARLIYWKGMMNGIGPFIYWLKSRPKFSAGGQVSRTIEDIIAEIPKGQFWYFLDILRDALRWNASLLSRVTLHWAFERLPISEYDKYCLSEALMLNLPK